MFRRFRTFPKRWPPRHPVQFAAKSIAITATVLATAYYWPEVSFFTRAVHRVARTAATVALISLDYKMHDTEQQRQDCHERAAKWLLWLFQNNGGIYIKLGQHLASLDFILPKPYTCILSTLFSQAPTSSPDEVRAVIEESLNEPLEQVFTEFEWTPIGAASLAQVHRARLHDCADWVAVKIQHRRLQGFADVDIVTAKVLVRAIKFMFPKFEFTWLADELGVNLPRELNFELEGHNAERTGRLFKRSGLMQVPRINWRYTRKRVLVMEYCDGVKVTDKKGLRAIGVRDLRKVSDLLTKAYSEMIFVHGFVHCDPHPGNILVTCNGHSDPQLILLDHGLYKELSDDFRLAYARLWRALVDGDEREICESADALGGGDAHRLFSCILTQRSWDNIRMCTLDQPRTLAEIESIKEKFPEYFEKVADLLAKVPRPLLLLLKTNDLLRSIDRCLIDDRFIACRSFLIMARYCAFASYEELVERAGFFTALMLTGEYLAALLKYRISEWLLRANAFAGRLFLQLNNNNI